MGFLLEESGCLVVTHVLYKIALVFALVRWVLSWGFKLRDMIILFLSSNSESCSSNSFGVSSQMIRVNLVLTTYGDIMDRLPQGCDTCAVCLSQLNEDDVVRELRNCCHVFHRECLDRWVDHDGYDHGCDQHGHDHEYDDNHKSCPLCRAPLLTSSQGFDWERSEPSWAVERILYLFGDDLLS